MSTGDASDYESSNGPVATYFVVGGLGLGVLFLVFRLPFWISYLSSDRVGQGLRLAGHKKPKRAFEGAYASRAPPLRHVSPVIAHLRTFYNSCVLPSPLEEHAAKLTHRYLLPSVILGLTVGQVGIMIIWLALVVAGLLYENDLSLNVRNFPLYVLWCSCP
jgi:hypothetical protein